MERIAALLLLVVAGVIAGLAVHDMVRSEKEPPSISSENLSWVCNSSDGQIIYGDLPNFRSEEDRQEWLAKLDTLGKSIRENGLLAQHFYPNGPVISYGFDYRGYFVVALENCSKIEKHELDAIYEIINREAGKLGIENIPVLFRFEGVPVAE
ncbi:hypothetical protein GAH_00441 [Geoglobus ahangari]|uniref:DUF3574 domain-containing protein n=1 Tax=Geoglobus ahangari TaxID=113653 RepID=A0A0F7IJ25_9EURY|nr:hypothetical protein [Geoglobus ahangari]AKG92207.1 hypothetical protein GAH_00441 [Geoglobus ahangari]